MTRGWRYGMVQVQFPRDFGGLFLQVAEVFCLEVGDVHHDAVRDARVCDGLPGFGNLCGEFDLSIANNLRVAKFNFAGESLFETERGNSQEAVWLSDDLPLEPFFECAILSI
jgi:hypothetical protein